MVLAQEVGSREHHGGRRSAHIAALWALTDGRWRREARGLRGCVQRRIDGQGWRPASNQLSSAGDAVTHEFFSGRCSESRAFLFRQRADNHRADNVVDAASRRQLLQLCPDRAIGVQKFPSRGSQSMPRGHGCAGDAKRSRQLAVVACFWSLAWPRLSRDRLGMSASPSGVLSHKTRNRSVRREADEQGIKVEM